MTRTATRLHHHAGDESSALRVGRGALRLRLTYTHMSRKAEQSPML